MNILEKFFLLMVIGGGWRGGIAKKYKSGEVLKRAIFFKQMVTLIVGLFFVFILYKFGFDAFAIIAIPFGIIHVTGMIWVLRKYKI